jgi:biotin carboxyl carrier protein
MKYIASVKNQQFTVDINNDGAITIDDEPIEIDFRRLPSGGITSLLLDNRSISAVVDERGDDWEVLIMGELYSVKVQDERSFRLAQRGGPGVGVDGEAVVKSPMPGIIVAVPVAEGDLVSLGDKVVILESMKMENELRAPCDGVITHVNVSAGASVEKDQALVTISPVED